MKKAGEEAVRVVSGTDSALNLQSNLSIEVCWNFGCIQKEGPSCPSQFH